MQIFAHHYLGAHDAALALVEPVVAEPVAPRHQWCVSVPNSVSARWAEARIRWMLGDAERARSVIYQALALAEHAHPFGMAQALAMAAIPIALWNGDTAEAESLVNALQELAHRGAPGFWHTWVPTFRRVIQQKNGLPAERAFAPDQDWQMPTHWAAQDLLGTLSADLITDEAMARVESGEVVWSAPEMLRLRGERLLQREGPGAAKDAQALFLRALEIARAQRAIAWERRIEASLARLHATN
jgi:hypothetical protein